MCMCKKLMDYCQGYINSLDIWEFGLIKICILAFGIMIGIIVPAKNKKGFLIGMGLIFAATYIYIMAGFVGMSRYVGESYDDDEDFDWVD